MVMILIFYLEMNKEILAKALAVVAYENGMEHVNKNVYIDSEGIKYVLTKKGFVNAVMENYHFLYDKLVEELESKNIDYTLLKNNYSKLVTLSKGVTEKQQLKLYTILSSNINDAEKVKQLKKYLNV